jgi:hypothetical protein
MEPRKFFGLIGLVALLAIGGCITPVYSPVPGPSKWTNGIPRAALQPPPQPPEPMLPARGNIPDFKSEISKLTPTGPRQMTLNWDSDAANTNCVFEIWRTIDLGPRQNFVLWSNAPETARSAAIPQGYYKMRTRSLSIWDPATGRFYVSDWSRK